LPPEDDATGQRSVLQPTPAYEFGEQRVGRYRDLMPSLLQLMTQASERRDIAVHR
jgi:hypothetical protein